MFRAFRSPLLAKVPYATLFSFNKVLEAVFAAPANKVALQIELPGLPTQHFTYGRLQRDVVDTANALVTRKEAVTAMQNAPSLGWTQPSKPSHVRSIFSQGERTPSCDYMQDTGFYTAALMSGPGYNYVVSLLACWAINQMATPMSVAQKYNDELMYVLEHSGCRTIIGETKLLADKFPAEYEDLYVRTSKELTHLSSRAVSGASTDLKTQTYQVNTVMDLQKLLVEWDAAHTVKQESMTPLSPEEIGVSVEPSALRTAEDITRRLDEEKEKVERRNVDHQENLRAEQFAEKNFLSSEDDETPLYFDSDKLRELNPLFRLWFEKPSARPSPYDDCLMIYTSGTTARPKGAVHTHASVTNMVQVLQDAWKWSSSDSILHVLPVHHVHGLVNVLLCSLASGARCVSTKFDNPVRIAKRLGEGDLTLMMAVPTIYTKLIAAIQKSYSSVEKTAFKRVCEQRIRLMVSGSAALPVPTLEQFREISGHTLLERYGMTEIGMALSQPLMPVSDRIPGTVGSPLPTVKALVYQPKDAEPSDAPKNSDVYDEVGALAIASESLFDRYWNNPTATRKELRVSEAGERYFDTGDTVGVLHSKDPKKPNAFAILGRSSIDIIKCRGYKLSALEIEAVLLSRKDLFYEVAVVGAKDDVRGEMVVAIVAFQPAVVESKGLKFDSPSNSLELPAVTDEMKKEVNPLLAHYKCPERYIVVPEIPRNPTGKVNKKNLKKLLNLP